MTAAFLAALQLADSALPIGRFVHSYGLEQWLSDHGEVAPETLQELVQAAVCESVAPLDGAVLAWSHRSRSTAELIGLDARLTARKLSRSARNASHACGRRLAALAAELAPDDAVAMAFARAVQTADTDGNLAVVEGTLARALGLSTREAVLVELRGSAAALLSAAVRLGAIAPVRAQVVLARLAPALERAADTAVLLSLDELSATAPELEIAALAHARADARMFAS